MYKCFEESLVGQLAEVYPSYLDDGSFHVLHIMGVSDDTIWGAKYTVRGRFSGYTMIRAGEITRLSVGTEYLSSFIAEDFSSDIFNSTSLSQPDDLLRLSITHGLPVLVDAGGEEVPLMVFGFSDSVVHGSAYDTDSNSFTGQCFIDRRNVDYYVVLSPYLTKLSSDAARG